MVLSDYLLQEIGVYGTKCYPKEFGGILIGEYTEDFKTLNIRDTILPKKYKGESYSFERSITGLVEHLKKIYQLKPSQYYVGEWHTHPDGSTHYSNTDLNSMIEIADCKTVNIQNPVLLILSVNKSKVNDLSLYVYDNKKLLKYE
ncbi:Mov34/MPN/PAD-1 family protein [Zunongwangia endophytica]|uniref:Mov34/MPN/PAD-1 family protein n=1 Tax=Zunongwangia endophytica TaxID=1808945 RepID=A0ABV8HAV6_9FLAO